MRKKFFPSPSFDSSGPATLTMAGETTRFEVTAIHLLNRPEEVICRFDEGCFYRTR